MWKRLKLFWNKINNIKTIFGKWTSEAPIFQNIILNSVKLKQKAPPQFQTSAARQIFSR